MVPISQDPTPIRVRAGQLDRPLGPEWCVPSQIWRRLVSRLRAKVVKTAPDITRYPHFSGPNDFLNDFPRAWTEGVVRANSPKSHEGRWKRPGGFSGLQNRFRADKVLGGFDSHPSPPFFPGNLAVRGPPRSNRGPNCPFSGRILESADSCEMPDFASASPSEGHAAVIFCDRRPAAPSWGRVL